MPRFRESAYGRFMRQRFREKPGCEYIFVESDSPPRRYQHGGYIGLTKVMRVLHCGFIQALRILDEENIQIHRVPVRDRHWLFVHKAHLPGLISRHANDFARERRMRAWGGNPQRIDLIGKCPRCGQQARFWRLRTRPNGGTAVRCSLCKRDHTMGVPAKRDPLKSTCPACGKTDRQRRQGFTKAGNRSVHCGHCGKNYVLQGDPEYVPPRIWPIRSRSGPEMTFEDLVERLKAGYSREPAGFIDSYPSETDTRRAQIDEALARQQAFMDRELRALTAYTAAEEVARDPGRSPEPHDINGQARINMTPAGPSQGRNTL